MNSLMRFFYWFIRPGPLPVFLTIFLSCLVVLKASANSQTVSLQLDQIADSPRWLYENKSLAKASPLIRSMVLAKKALKDSKSKLCLSELAKVEALGKSLGPWTALNKLQCAQIREANKINVSAITQTLQRIDREPNWLLIGPAAYNLRTQYVTALMQLGEFYTKSDRKKAWPLIEKLKKIDHWMSAENRAQIYRWAGELSFTEQKLADAQDFFQRSLNEKENSEVRLRLEGILAVKAPQAKVEQKIASSKPDLNQDLGVSDEEKQIYTRMKQALLSQDLVSAIDDGIELIVNYSGSRRAQEASDRILELYLSLAQKTEQQFTLVRERILSRMLKADASRLLRWANNAYVKGSYKDAVSLAERALEKLNKHPDSTKAFLLAGKSAVAGGQYSEARRFFEKLIEQHSGTSEAAEATFRLGLIDYRSQKYLQASGYFERTLALSAGQDFEYRALYWNWRSQQKLKSDRATEYVQALMAKYPMSYYGLRARAEANNQVLELKDKKILANKMDLRFLESERLAWERLQILTRAGWYKEAESELEGLPKPLTNEERAVHSKFWTALFRQDLASQTLTPVLESHPDYFNASILQIIFPLEFAQFIEKESARTGVNQSLIRSLIRQESSFRPEVRSPANAIGVMQLLPSTALELARDLKLKAYQGSESLLDPEINIKLGSLYLSRLIKNFNGHVPLALAAYNAGPARLKRWLNARSDLQDLDSKRSSSADLEIWIDELPWDETSFYVKAILRNWMIYQVLSGSKLTLSDPIWMDVAAPTR